MPDDPNPESESPVNRPPDLHDAQVVIDLFGRAARQSLEDPYRKGSCCHLPAKGRLLMTGDLHDHLLNYQRIVKLADLGADKDNLLILHEVIHGEHKIDGRDHSIRMLTRVAALATQYPDQVHVMLGNHELAQLTGADILKGGHSSVSMYDQGLEFIFDEDSDVVRQAMQQFIRSMLLAVRCPNGVFCSHSLPSPYALDAFDPGIIDRIPTDEEMEH
ncbi:MAG: metallophosphoesterase, partial [Planctomycetes bacterium]|nr:metallophosphoesterase [Planctomycetota bacterium]